MSISLDDLVERLKVSLADIERRNYGNAAQGLANTISILKVSGIRTVARPTITNQESEQNDSEA